MNTHHNKFKKDLIKKQGEEAIEKVKAVTRRLTTGEEFEKLRFFYTERTGEVNISGISEELANQVMRELEND